MRPAAGLLFLILALVATPAFATTTFTVHASGAEESPPNNSAASGSATFVLDQAQASMTFTVTFSGLEGPLTGAHIHRMTASPGGGAPAIGLAPPLGVTEATFSGTLTNLSAATISDLLAGQYYLNIHSSEYPDGELRGTLVQEPGTPALPVSWGRIKALFR